MFWRLPPSRRINLKKNNNFSSDLESILLIFCLFLSSNRNSKAVLTLNCSNMIIRLAEGNLQTKFGDYHEILFYDGQKESIALIMGNVYGEEQVLCRIHSSCIAAHYFNSTECDCREQMEIAQRLIQQSGKGIIIYLDQEGKGNGHFALLKSKP